MYIFYGPILISLVVKEGLFTWCIQIKINTRSLYFSYDFWYTSVFLKYSSVVTPVESPFLQPECTPRDNLARTFPGPSQGEPFPVGAALAWRRSSQRSSPGPACP